MPYNAKKIRGLDNFQAPLQKIATEDLGRQYAPTFGRKIGPSHRHYNRFQIFPQRTIF